MYFAVRNAGWQDDIRLSNFIASELSVADQACLQNETECKKEISWLQKLVLLTVGRPTLVAFRLRQIQVMVGIAIGCSLSVGGYH